MSDCISRQNTIVILHPVQALITVYTFSSVSYKLFVTRLKQPIRLFNQQHLFHRYGQQVPSIQKALRQVFGAGGISERCQAKSQPSRILKICGANKTSPQIIILLTGECQVPSVQRSVQRILRREGYLRNGVIKESSWKRVQLTWGSVDESHLDIKKLKSRTFQEKGILKAGNVRCKMMFFSCCTG